MDIKQTLIDYQQQGFPVINFDEQLAILDFIESHSMECPVTLYRGISLDEKKEFHVGDIFKASKELFDSFTENDQVAADFASRFESGIILVLDETAGLPIYVVTENENEVEWLIPTTEYLVVEVCESEYFENIVMVRISKNEK